MKKRRVVSWLMDPHGGGGEWWGGLRGGCAGYRTPTRKKQLQSGGKEILKTPTVGQHGRRQQINDSVFLIGCENFRKLLIISQKILSAAALCDLRPAGVTGERRDPAD